MEWIMEQTWNETSNHGMTNKEHAMELEHGIKKINKM